MAVDISPVTWLGAGYAEDAVNHLIKFNTNDAVSDNLLVQLTDAEANASTGDIRTIAFALSEALYLAWIAQAANQTKNMTMRKSAAAQKDGTISYTYTFAFIVEPPSGEYNIPAEPT